MFNEKTQPKGIMFIKERTKNAQKTTLHKKTVKQDLCASRVFCFLRLKETKQRLSCQWKFKDYVENGNLKIMLKMEI